MKIFGLNKREKKTIEKIETVEEFSQKLHKLLKNSRSTLTQFRNLKNDTNKLANNKILEIENKYAGLQELEKHIITLIREKSKGFPWISDVIAQYYEARELRYANYLQNKPHPARNAAADVREIAREKRILKKKFLIARNFVRYYETLFPWIQDYVGDDLDELIEQINTESKDDEDDPVRKFVPDAEYKKLSIPERNQKALDRYWNRNNKPNWEIGRDYERYVGYLYEVKDYKVEYTGIEKGLSDFGRDLICRKNGVTDVVQCKYWSKNKIIHEKHINQLFGTTVKFLIDEEERDVKVSQLSLFPELMKENNVNATFYTTTELSETAKKFAKALGIRVFEDHIFNREYPCIKCNISSNGDRIYHLPFDQQYDKVIIDRKKGELYVKTVAEAEYHGFRRAYRWSGN